MKYIPYFENESKEMYCVAGMVSLLAKHVVHSAHDGYIILFNRTRAKLHEFAASTKGIVAVDSLQEVASKCNITFSCLSNDDALKAVFHDFLRGLPEKKNTSDDIDRVYVDCSTVLPSTTTYLAALGAEHGVYYCHCPVFGRPDAAAAGRLLAYISGATEMIRRQISGLVGVTFAQAGVHDLGDDPAAATRMKLLGNSYIAGHIELAGQTLALGAKSQLPQESVLDLMHYITSSPVAMGYARRMAAGDYEAGGTGFTVDLALKDVSHIQTLGREVGCPLPVADLVMGHLISAKARHGGQLDWGAVGLAIRDAAGLPSSNDM